MMWFDVIMLGQFYYKTFMLRINFLFYIDDFKCDRGLCDICTVIGVSIE